MGTVSILFFSETLVTSLNIKALGKRKSKEVNEHLTVIYLMIIAAEVNNGQSFDFTKKSNDRASKGGI